MKFTDITDKAKHIGEYNLEEKIEVSTIADKPKIYADNEQDRKNLEGVFYE